MTRSTVLPIDPRASTRDRPTRNRLGPALRRSLVAFALAGLLGGLAAGPALADGWHDHGWHENGQHDNGWHRGWHHRHWDRYREPRVYYVPPPVYYAPPPPVYYPPPVVYAPPPSVSFVFPFVFH